MKMDERAMRYLYGPAALLNVLDRLFKLGRLPLVPCRDAFPLRQNGKPNVVRRAHAANCRSARRSALRLIFIRNRSSVVR